MSRWHQEKHPEAWAVATGIARAAWVSKQEDEPEPSTGRTEWLDFDEDLGSHREYLIYEALPLARAAIEALDTYRAAATEGTNR